MRVLITGGCGYVGSHVVRACVVAGHDVTVLDCLEPEPGTRWVRVKYVRGSFTTTSLEEIVGDVVIHLAADTSVAASINAPSIYWRNNVSDAIDMLDNLLAKTKCRKIVFASSAAVYCPNDDGFTLLEDELTIPSNPYGETKLAFERVLLAYKRAYGLDPVILRLFNVAGGSYRENHSPETHLIPNIVDAARVSGKVKINGDGLAMRDYVSANDVADAFVRALSYEPKAGEEVINIGSGYGHSVHHVFNLTNHVGKIRQHGATIDRYPAREGDPKTLVADISRAERVLRWRPTESLEKMIGDVFVNRS